MRNEYFKGFDVCKESVIKIVKDSPDILNSFPAAYKGKEGTFLAEYCIGHFPLFKYRTPAQLVVSLRHFAKDTKKK